MPKCAIRTLMLTLCIHPDLLSKIAFLLPLEDTYKCGAIFDKNTRSVFHYERSENATTTNSTDDFRANITQQINTLDLDQLKFDVPQSDITWHLEGDESELEQVMEEPILQEVIGHTRIVNGEECPPGECPWQVDNIPTVFGHSHTS